MRQKNKEIVQVHNFFFDYRRTDRIYLYKMTGAKFEEISN